MVADTAANMEVHTVADMEVDNIFLFLADMLLHMVVNIKIVLG